MSLPALIISAVTWSIPGTIPFFNDFIALLSSLIVGSPSEKVFSGKSISGGSNSVP